MKFCCKNCTNRMTYECQDNWHDEKCDKYFELDISTLTESQRKTLYEMAKILIPTESTEVEND